MSWNVESPQVAEPAVSILLKLGSDATTCKTLTISTFWLKVEGPKTPDAWAIAVVPSDPPIPTKENDEVPPQSLTLLLNVVSPSTSRLFLIVVVPPWPAILTSEAFNAKSIVCVLPEKKLTIPASVDRVTTVSYTHLTLPTSVTV